MTTTASRGENGLPERPQNGAETWYEVLDVPRGTRGEALERAYHRALALVEGKSLGGYFLLDPEATDAARQDIEAAWTVLSDPQRRRAYDASLDLASRPPRASGQPVDDGETHPPISADETNEASRSDARGSVRILSPVDDATAPPAPRLSTPPTPVAPPGSRDVVDAPDLFDSPSGSHGGQIKDVTGKVALRRGGIAFAMPKTDVGDPVEPRRPRIIDEPEGVASVIPRRVDVPIAHTPTPPPGLFTLDGEVNGQLLKRLREARHLTIDELADATKIRKVYLRAIEEVDLENLPGRVFLRGFLTQIARVLRVDKVKLADGYLQFVARFQK